MKNHAYDLLHIIPFEDLVGLLNLAILEIDVIFKENRNKFIAENLNPRTKSVIGNANIQGGVRGQNLWEGQIKDLPGHRLATSIWENGFPAGNSG